ncbi:transposase [Candidatus Pacearchaeota archaeon]|nr:transposase [Candidatus Pacearchaeota archaeon]
MVKLFNSLSEKDRRRFAAFEARRLGHGGIKYIMEVLGCDDKTIKKGLLELDSGPSFDLRIRKKGSGRKRSIETIRNIDETFLKVLKNHTAGDPMNENVKWTNLTQKEISEKMKEERVNISVTVVKQLLHKHGFVKRKQQKNKTMKYSAGRDEQFKIINSLRDSYEKTGNPIISVDAKKKEQIGNFYREGTVYAKEPIQTYDHDFIKFSSGVVIPHGVYDIKRNTGFVNIGTSHETAEFATDSLFYWWKEEGEKNYPNANSILMLCDGGGSNSSRHYVFKEALQKLVNKINIEIRVAHYPPYTSKYNPIEHRLFPHITRACKGVVFKSVELVKTLIEKAKTSKGLKVVANVINKVYETGKKVAEGFKENMGILFDKFLPKWNYRVVPEKKKQEVI